jgi:hypothetical protein
VVLEAKIFGGTGKDDRREIRANTFSIVFKFAGMLILIS